MASVDLQEKANFTRLGKLLVDKGTEALRNTLDAKYPPANLPAVLNANRISLLKLKPRVINDSQWDLLFPPSGNPPDSKTFDVTLLTVLLRNICGFPSPATGWNTMPPDTDRSPQANIVRIKLFRNQVYAHVTLTQLDNATFESLWQTITQALVELNIPQNDVDDLKICPLGPEEEIYLEALKIWKSQEEECIAMLEILSNDVKSVESSINRLEQITEETRDEKDEDILRKLAKHNFKSKIRGKVRFFMPGTREWLLKQVNEWFDEDKHDSRILLLTAGPGFGKSVFAAKVCDDFEKKGKLAASHFCNFSDSNLRDPMMMLQSLASQMCETVVGFKEKLLDQLKRPHQVRNLKDAFGIYLQNPLDELEVEEPSLVVIDGLDESAADDKNEIVNLIADNFPELPECIKVLVTSRPGISVAKLNGFQKINIESNDANNELDLQFYFKACLPSLADMKADLFVCETLVRMCEGSFQYAFHFQSDLQKRDVHDLENIMLIKFDEAIEFLPKGLDAIYKAYFKHLEDELKAIVHENLDILKVLEMIVARRGLLPLKFITRTLGLASDCRETKKIIYRVNETVSCLLYVSDDQVTIFHRSVNDWLLARGYEDHEYAVKMSEAKKSLWIICEKVFEEIKKTVCSGHDLNLTSEVKYALDHGLRHLVECKMKEKFYWLVDVVIIHVLSTIYPKDLWFIKRELRGILDDGFVISDELRARMVWHVLEIDYLERELNPVVNFPFKNSQFYYLQSVLTHSPKGYFSDNERKLAETLLLKVPRFMEFNSHEVEVMPLAISKQNIRMFSAWKIRTVGVSCDKTMAAVAQTNGRIRVVCIPSLAELWQYSTQCESISCCTFSPDDSFVLFGLLETVLNIAEKKEVTFFRGNKETFTSCAFSLNGKRLVTSNDSSTVKLWDIGEQCLLSSLCADVLVNWCSFSSTGLFIIAENKSTARDLFCVWNAITWQRCDERNLAEGVLWSKKCYRCLRPGFKEINSCKRLEREPRLLSITCIWRSTGIYNGLECSFALDEQSLKVIDNTHFTTLALWNLFVNVSYDPLFDNYFRKIAKIEDDLWFYADLDKLIVFRTLPPTQEQHCLPKPTRVLWSSFSPDGSRLATCTSDGYINIWNADTSKLKQRFQSNHGAPIFACWWSRNLFVFDFFDRISSLTKYPVDINLTIQFSQSQQVSLSHLVDEFVSLSAVNDFSKGLLSFQCGTTKPVKVVDVNGVEGPQMVSLPGIEPMMNITVSPGASFVFGACRTKCVIWKRNADEPGEYEVVFTQLDESISNYGFECCFSNDSKVALVSIKSYLPQIPAIYAIVDLDTDNHKWVRSDGTNLKLFCLNKERVVIAACHQLIEILDMDSGAFLGSCYQRYLTYDLLNQTKLSPKGTVLAFPTISGKMEFRRLYIAQNPLFSDANRCHAAIRSRDHWKKIYKFTK